MSVHAFVPGREPGRCARCGCAVTEAVHGGAGVVSGPWWRPRGWRCEACGWLNRLGTAACAQCGQLCRGTAAGHDEIFHAGTADGA